MIPLPPPRQSLCSALVEPKSAIAHLKKMLMDVPNNYCGIPGNEIADEAQEIDIEEEPTLHIYFDFLVLVISYLMFRCQRCPIPACCE